MNPVRFRSGLNVDVLNTSQLFMLSDNDQVLMDNRAAAEVARVVDGRRDVAGLVAAASQRVDPATAFAVVRSMLGKGYLREGEPVGGSFGSYLEGRGSTPRTRSRGCPPAG